MAGVELYGYPGWSSTCPLYRLLTLSFYRSLRLSYRLHPFLREFVFYVMRKCLCSILYPYVHYAVLYFLCKYAITGGVCAYGCMCEPVPSCT